MIKKNQKTVIVSSNYAWTIFNFRMPLIRRLKSDGYKVVVLTQFDGYESLIATEVNQIRKLFISRKGVNPLLDFLTILDFIKSIIIVKPDLLLLFTIKPVIYGSIAARLTNIEAIVMITGLGSAFISGTWIKKVVKILYRFALSSVPVVFFQNNDDKNLFLREGFVNKKACRMVPGSGVDLERFKFTNLPKSKKVVFLFVGRMLWDKGIGEFVDAARRLKSRYPNVRFQLLGPCGVENRTSISNLKMNEWQKEGFIEYLGETDNVASYIVRATCIVLPSYREGTSRVLLEAAAMGRPLIATNVPGCREVIDHRITGFLCKPRDSTDLSEKIEQMIKLPHEVRSLMGTKGREKVENGFDQEIVCDLYAEAMGNCKV